jgi:hypothetical protein
VCGCSEDDLRPGKRSRIERAPHQRDGHARVAGAPVLEVASPALADISASTNTTMPRMKSFQVALVE